LKHFAQALLRLFERVIKTAGTSSRRTTEAPARPSVTDLVTSGDAANRERNWSTAQQCYRAALALDPSLGATWVQLGHALKESGDAAGAEEAYLRASQLEPHNADLLLNRGHLAKTQGKMRQAALFYQKSFEIDGNGHAKHELSQPAISSILEWSRSLDGQGADPSSPFLEVVGSNSDRRVPTSVLAWRRPRGSSPGEKADIGFVESATVVRVSGYLESEYINSVFFLDEDGKRTLVRPSFRNSSDLAIADIEAVGFEILVPPGFAGTAVRLGVERKPGVVDFLRFAETGQHSFVLWSDDPELMVVETKDFSSLLHAIPPDSSVSLELNTKYAQRLAFAGHSIDVLMIDGTLGSPSTRYRIFNIAEGLRHLGKTVCCVRLDQVDYRLVARMRVSVAVFFRIGLDERTDHILKAMKAQRARVIFDVDDLVFDESVVSSIDGVKNLGEAEREGYLDGVRSYRRMMMEAEIITAPTDFLVDYAAGSTGKPAFKVVNSIGKEAMLAFQNLHAREQERIGDFLIGYYSGSRTHQADFRAAYRGLVEFMRKTPDARFRLVGLFDLSEFSELTEFGERIQRVGFLGYHDMLHNMSECDVVIAPLEEGNPFCEAKSELKFFESALVWCYCISSATQTFRRAVAGEKIGLLASTDDEWAQKLKDVYHWRIHDLSFPVKARARVLEVYSYVQSGEQALNAYFWRQH
jgi:hypothetical protein